jgi:hypothetical protein
MVHAGKTACSTIGPFAILIDHKGVSYISGTQCFNDVFFKKRGAKYFVVAFNVVNGRFFTGGCSDGYPQKSHTELLKFPFHC